MITRTYINKFNTIIKDSTLNTGLNPIAELSYGTSNTRLLVYFDHCKVKKMMEDKIFPDISKMRHTLKITNSGSLDFAQVICGDISSIDDNVRLRASSFDLIFFLIPKFWDNGKGYDYQKNFFNQGYYGKGCKNNQSVETSRLVSTNGSNWFQARNGYKWDEPGVYSNKTLSIEYDNFASNSGSTIIIGRQHFDIGTENISFDITDIFNKFLTGELENYGIGIAYTPMTELEEMDVEKYIGFLTNKTNTFFEPFVETVYDDYISDDRSNFVLNKDNRLYLYCNIGGMTENLDELPTCSVNDTEYEVKQFSKGIYYIDIKLSSDVYKPNTMLYDVWDNIIYNGEKLDPVELDFVLKPSSMFFNVGNSLEESVKLTPTIYGIDSNEKIKRGDIRKIVINPRVAYKKNLSELVDEVYYRVYVKDGEREIDVISYEKANKTFLENYFLIDTNILIPNRYYIDVKFKYNLEMILNHNVLSFDVVDDLNNKYN